MSSKQNLTWTKVQPGTSGWYWMVKEEPGLPTIVQIVRDSASGRLLALIPASRYPESANSVADPERVDALWAGPLTIPSVIHDSLDGDTRRAA